MKTLTSLAVASMLCACLAACGGITDDEAAPTGAGGSGSAGAAGSPSGGGASAGASGSGQAAGAAGAGAAGSSSGGIHTLDNCVTSFSDDAPAFFKKYFKCVDVKVSGGQVVISTNNLPPHKSPYYPKTDPNWKQFDTMGGDRFQNPNTLSQQAITVAFPLEPKPRGLTIDATMVDQTAADNPYEYHWPMGSAGGVCLDGVAMFHGVAAPGDKITQEEHTFDDYEGHPENTGMYHYHSSAPGPLEVLKSKGLVTQTKPGSAEIEVYGVMCDGTLVLGCTELDGSAPDTATFDGQAGHVHDIKDKEATHFTQRYHTHVCRGKYVDDFAPEIQYYSSCSQGVASTGTGGMGGGMGGMTGGMGGMTGGMTPKSCTTESDCTNACPPGSKSCGCVTSMMTGGSICVPTCQTTADCPSGGPTFTCSMNGVCIPMK